MRHDRRRKSVSRAMTRRRQYGTALTLPAILPLRPLALSDARRWLADRPIVASRHGVAFPGQQLYGPRLGRPDALSAHDDAKHVTPYRGDMTQIDDIKVVMQFFSSVPLAHWPTLSRAPRRFDVSRKTLRFTWDIGTSPQVACDRLTRVAARTAGTVANSVMGEFCLTRSENSLRSLRIVVQA